MARRVRCPILWVMLVRRCLLVVFGAGVLLGCQEPAPRRPRPTRAQDKAALYGDAALLPTRQGERARVEIALAEDLRVALETLHAVEAARVTVTTASDGAPRSAALVIRTSPEGSAESVRKSAERIARASLGSDAMELAIEISTPTAGLPPSESPAQRPFVLFAVLGLGISIGLTLDRGRRLFRRRR